MNGRGRRDPWPAGESDIPWVFYCGQPCTLKMETPQPVSHPRCGVTVSLPPRISVSSCRECFYLNHVLLKESFLRGYIPYNRGVGNY